MHLILRFKESSKLREVGNMADVTFQSEDGSRIRRGDVRWDAIWAGSFTFVAIWSIFEILGFVIFAAESLGHIQIGIGIWTIVLTIIAMWVAGHATGRLAGFDGRYEATMHGMVMFGLSVTAMIVLILSGGTLLAGNASASVHDMAIVGPFGWVVFLSLLLGWLAAMWGAAAGVRTRAAVPRTVHDIRTAA
jgi:hypothetical protein